MSTFFQQAFTLIQMFDHGSAKILLLIVIYYCLNHQKYRAGREATRPTWAGRFAPLALILFKNTARPLPIIGKFKNFLETCQIAFKFSENIWQSSPQLYSKNH